VESGETAEVFLHPQHPVTRRLVADAAGLAGAQTPGALRLTFRGEATYQPILGRIARDTGVDYSILAGRIDRIRDEPYGQLLVSLVGGDVALARARLTAAGVRVEEA
jgi:D-methionine transport system ATP-binding protein